MVYHSLNISNPAVAVQLSAKPLEFEILKVFIDIGKNPTATSHKWSYVLPKMENGSLAENFTITESAYSITLPGKQIRDALSGISNDTGTNTESPLQMDTTISIMNASENGNQSVGNTLFVGIKREGKWTFPSLKPNKSKNIMIILTDKGV